MLIVSPVWVILCGGFFIMYNRFWQNYKPLEDIVMSEIPVGEFDYKNFTHRISLPKDKPFSPITCTQRVRTFAEYRTNVIYSTEHITDIFYIHNYEKFMKIELISTQGKSLHNSRIKRELTTIFNLFYNNRHADWQVLFDVYKLKELL